MAPLPEVVSIAKLGTPTKTKQERWFEVFPDLYNQSKDKEPDTLSHYLYTSTSEDDTGIYSFEAYRTMSALTDVHAKSNALKELATICKAEDLCSVEFELLKPIGGFILRSNQVQKPVDLIVLNQFVVPDGTHSDVRRLLAWYADYLSKEERDGCLTYLILEKKGEKQVWTFERYSTEDFYEDQHCVSDVFKSTVPELSPFTSTYKESRFGFLQK